MHRFSRGDMLYESKPQHDNTFLLRVPLCLCVKVCVCFLYVCVNVCVYVYVYMHVCMYACMSASLCVKV